MKRKKFRRTEETLLIVVEGYADIAFIEYLKNNYHKRGIGFRIDIKNARGKGALNVIQYAVRLSKQYSYSDIFVMFDTDKDWSSEAKQIVKLNKFIIFPCEPCLEAELLRLLYVPNFGDFNTTDKIKRLFLERIGNEAHRIDDFGKILPLDLIERSKLDSLWLSKIISTLSIGRAE